MPGAPPPKSKTDAKSDPVTESDLTESTAERARSTVSGSAVEGGKDTASRAPLLDMFGIDVRALAAFRIAIGMIVIWDLILRARDLEAHYTDTGVLPRTTLIDSYLALHPYLSVHILGGSTQFEALLFIAAGVCAAALVVGYRCRQAAFACWFLTCSLQARNPLILHGGDDLLRLLLFWSMFVPLGVRWSIDRARASAVDSVDNPVSSWGTAGLMLQLCFMYLFSGIMKSHPSWRHDGTAVYLALSIDQFATVLGRALLPYHNLLMALTFGTLALELAGPFIALFSFTNARVRTIVVTAFILFHIGLGLCIELGIFPAVCIAGWLLFMPARFWDSLEPRISAVWQYSAQRVPEPINLLLRRILHRIPKQPLRQGLSREANLAAGLFLLYILLWNLRASNYKRLAPFFPERLTVLGEAARVEQNWSLFAPYPALEHGWYVADAHLHDGTELDLLTERPVHWDKPALVSATYKNERWRKYLMNLSNGQYSRYRPLYAQYLERVWNDSHPPAQRLARLEIYFVLEKALPNYQVSPAEHIRLWTQDWP